MRISDWSSDVCSSDLRHAVERSVAGPGRHLLCVHLPRRALVDQDEVGVLPGGERAGLEAEQLRRMGGEQVEQARRRHMPIADELQPHRRSEEHTSELQSLMRTSYAVFCLKKKN